VRARLERLCDGELAPVEAALDRGHLEACAACALERDRLERTLCAARDELRARAVSSEPWARESVESGGQWRVAFALLTAAAAVLLLCALQASGLGVDRVTAPTLPKWSLSVAEGVDALRSLPLGGTTR